MQWGKRVVLVFYINRFSRVSPTDAVFVIPCRRAVDVSRQTMVAIAAIAMMALVHLAA